MTLECYAITEEPGPEYEEALLRRLIRVGLRRTEHPNLEALRRWVLFAAYTDACDAGLTTKANLVLSSLLGGIDDRTFEPVALEHPKDEEYDPNQCISCGHPGKIHSLGGLHSSAGCNVAGCKCKGFDNDPAHSSLATTPKVTTTPANVPCTCGHMPGEHNYETGACYKDGCSCGMFTPNDYPFNYDWC